MATFTSKNLSHRKLFRQSNKQPIKLDMNPIKTAQNLSKRVIDITNTLSNNKQHQTSINADEQRDTSLSKKLAYDKQSNKQMQSLTSINYHLKSTLNFNRRPSKRKFKSVDVNEKPKQDNIIIKRSFTIKKLLKISASASQAKFTSMEDLDLHEIPKKIERIDYTIPKSENYLKQTLKKCNINKLKIKVKDPFQRRTKLDLQFQGNSFIQKMQDSMISTLNQEQFKELLNKIT